MDQPLKKASVKLKDKHIAINHNYSKYLRDPQNKKIQNMASKTKGWGDKNVVFLECAQT